MSEGIDISNKLTNYLNSVYSEKNKIKSVVQSRYSKNLGSDFTTYANQLQSVNGNKILGRMASNSLSVDYPNPVFGHKFWLNQAGTKYDYYIGGYDGYQHYGCTYKIRQVKAFNVNDYSPTDVVIGHNSSTDTDILGTKITVFPEIKELNIDSEAKFLFWMFGRMVNNLPKYLFIEFPNLEKLTIHNINTTKYFRGSGFGSSGYGLFTDDTGESFFKNYTVFLFPKLKIIDDELLNILIERNGNRTNFMIDQDYLSTQEDRNFNITDDYKMYENGNPIYSNLITLTYIHIERKDQ